MSEDMIQLLLVMIIQTVDRVFALNFNINFSFLFYLPSLESQTSNEQTFCNIMHASIKNG